MTNSKCRFLVLLCTFSILSKSVRTKDEQKRIAIRDATIIEVVKGGLTSASIAKIAKRAKLAQGTIYLYFDTKEDLLRQTYIEIKHMMRDSLMNHYDPSGDSATNIRDVWFALLEYAISHPNHFTFAEYITSANLFGEREEPELKKIEKEMKAVILTAIEDGTLIDAPYESLQVILVAPVNALSKKITMQKQRISKQVKVKTFDLIWQGIAKR